MEIFERAFTCPDCGEEFTRKSPHNRKLFGSDIRQCFMCADAKAAA